MNLLQIKEILNELSFEIDFEKSHENEIFIYIGSGKESRSIKDVLSGMMNALFINLENKFKEYIYRAVITVPAYFDENSRRLIKEAAILAGFDVLRLINEPTAAALSYIHNLNNENNLVNTYLVYDFGGGTFDISILKTHQKDFFRVIGIGGDKYLGGDDIDRALMEYIFTNLNLKIENFDLGDRNNILYEIRKFKEKLNNLENSSEAIQFESIAIKSQKIKINFDEFNLVISKIINKTIDIISKTIEDAKIDISSIDSVILVGGSSRLKIIKNKIIDFFRLHNKDIKILDFLNPDEIVASGAALYALNLNPVINEIENDKDEKYQFSEFISWRKKFKQYFIDAISQNLGIEVGDGICEFMVLKNTPIPITVKEIFSNQIENQNSMRISICQGESKIFTENTFLGEFFIENLPNAKMGELKIEISFHIDQEGIVLVFAKLLNNQDEKTKNFESYFLKI